MPVVGEVRKSSMGSNYRKSPLYEYAKVFKETAQQILREDGVDMFEEPKKVFRHTNAKNLMKQFFTENAFDANNKMYDAIDIEDKKAMQEAQFENDATAILEHKAPADIAPMIGMCAPIHKYIMMNCVFASTDGIQKVVTRDPKVTVTMERRFLVTPDGTEIDIALQQRELADAMNSTNPVKNIELDLPVAETVDIVGDFFGGSSLDNLDVTTHISAVLVEDVMIEQGDILPNEDGIIARNGQVAEKSVVKNVWFPVEINFTPNYGKSNHFDRAVTQGFSIVYKKAKKKDQEEYYKTNEEPTDATPEMTQINPVITGSMNKNRFIIADIGDGKIKKVRLSAKLDSSSAMLETCHTEWTTDTDYFEIGSGVPLSVTISPDEMKDIAALYNENQLTKHMSMFSDVMLNHKNDSIKKSLDNSYNMLDERNGFYDTFDFAPPQDYALTALEYRSKMFMDFVDRYVSKMLQVLNDPNFTITIYGDPLIINAVSPKEYDYKAPESLGPVQLNYEQTIACVNQKRVYNFIGADNLRNTNELILVLKPHNSERITYRIYDYQLFVSDEVGNISNPVLPAIYAFERWRFYEYQPVQGRCTILNPSGLRTS